MLRLVISWFLPYLFIQFFYFFILHFFFRDKLTDVMKQTIRLTCDLVNFSLFDLTSQHRDTADAEIKIPSAENPEINGFMNSEDGGWSTPRSVEENQCWTNNINERMVWSASAFLSPQILWFMDAVLWLCPHNEWNIKMAHKAAHLNAELLRWQCSE